jgi:hypothetical protein
MALVLFCARKKHVTGVNGVLKTTAIQAAAYLLVCFHMVVAGWIRPCCLARGGHPLPRGAYQNAVTEIITDLCIKF